MTQVSPIAYTNVLRVSRIRLGVRLGFEKEERAQVQAVEVDLAFFFPAVTAPSREDKGDFICYDKVSHALKALCEGKEYRLIEYLCLEMHNEVRKFAVPEVKITLRVTKCQLPISFVLAGASFTYSDLPPFAWTPPL